MISYCFKSIPNEFRIDLNSLELMISDFPKLNRSTQRARMPYFSTNFSLKFSKDLGVPGKNRTEWV